MKEESVGNARIMGAAANCSTLFACYGIIDGKPLGEIAVLAFAGVLWVGAIEASFFISDQVRISQGGPKARPYTTTTLIWAVWYFLGVVLAGQYFDGFAPDKRDRTCIAGLFAAGAWVFFRTVHRDSKSIPEAIRLGNEDEQGLQ